MGGGAWPFLVGGAICLVNSVNERDLSLLTSYAEVRLRGQLLRGTMALQAMEEFLVSASHQLALTTSLPFVHTARRSYRLNDPVKCLDRVDDGGSWDGPPSVVGRRYPPLANGYPTVIGSAVMRRIRPILLTRPRSWDGPPPAVSDRRCPPFANSYVAWMGSAVVRRVRPIPRPELRMPRSPDRHPSCPAPCIGCAEARAGAWRVVGKVCPMPWSPNRVVRVRFGPPVSPVRCPTLIELKQLDVAAGRADGTGLHVLLAFPLSTSATRRVSFDLHSTVAPWHGDKALLS
eukprot:Gb_19262 [translate_table: standard]